MTPYDLTLPGGIDWLTGYKNPSEDAMKYLDQMPAEIKKYFEPYINAGNRALTGIEDQYGQLIKDPGSRLNEIGKGYQQSPGFDFALKQALGAGGRAAAAGGMAGSPMHEQQNMQTATGLANQDYNQWLQNALGLYGTGLHGSHDIYNTGAKAGMGLGENLASILAGKAGLAYAGQNAQNQHRSDLFGNIIGGIGSAFAF